MPRVEFFFDCSSPWTYLAFDRIEALCREEGAELIWKPILVGGVFNAVNQELYELRAHQNPRKEKYYNHKDLQDWARFYGLRINFMPSVFPVNSVKAMRGAFVADERGKLPAYARRVFEAYWGEDQDISQDEVLGRIVERVGLRRAEFFDKIASATYKNMLRDTTQDLIDRQGFGSPTMFVDGADMYFGNDRLPLVREAIRRARQAS
ncbi:MAG: 2-hydroxychromene-2-carboxylate isomerase [Candidatus Lambdaproteobacteria bacterium]|nr:2-hydroxychromene-2-carboxylate isomerase [Candidatus Lambdaproteobacteria bacterium]